MKERFNEFIFLLAIITLLLAYQNDNLSRTFVQV